MIKKGLLFLNGDIDKNLVMSLVKSDYSLIVCADGAYDKIKGLIVPDVVIGDFDSIVTDVEDGIKVHRFPIEKDYTDAHLCVDFIIDQGINEIDIVGATGGRTDHLYANLSLLYQAKLRGISAVIVNSSERIEIKDGKFSYNNVKGKTISLVPFLSTSHIIITKGLKYEMKDKVLDRRHILGISNIAIDDVVEVESVGEVLVFLEYDS